MKSLATLQLQRMAGDLLSRLHTLQAMSNPEPPTLGDLPESLVTRFVGKNQRYLLKIYSKANIWDMDAMERFVRDVRSVDCRATGNPLQTYEAPDLPAASEGRGENAAAQGFSGYHEFRVSQPADDEAIRHCLPPQPPVTLDWLFQCNDEQVRAFTARFDYFRLVLDAREVPADELLATSLQAGAAARPESERETFLVEAGRELARLLAGDPVRLEGLLRRLRTR